MYSLAHSTLTQVTGGNGERYLQQALKKEAFDPNPNNINDWITNNNFDFISTTLANNAYAAATFDDRKEPQKYGDRQKISFTRNVLFVRPSYWIVSDYVWDQQERTDNTYEIGWNFGLNNNTTINKVNKKAVTHYASKSNLQIVPADSNDTKVEFLPSIFASGNVWDFNYLANSKKPNGSKVNFDTILFTVKQDDNMSNVETKRIPIEGVAPTTATALEINRTTVLGKQEKVYYYYSHEAQALRNFGDYLTDGKLVFIGHKNDNEISTVMMSDGTKLADKGINLISSQNKVKNITATFDLKDQLQLLSTNTIVDLNWLTIYAPKLVEFVLLNGDLVNFVKDGDYIKLTGEYANIKSEFSDMNNHWAKTYVDNLYNQKIVKGISEIEFSPDATITRAEFVALIVRAMKLSARNEDVSFEDVDKNSWYSELVKAAVSNDIVSGSDGLFRPQDNITREEMAKILVSAYSLKGKDDNSASKLLLKDSDLFSEWASNYIEKTASLGFMVGNDDGNFAPQANATRAESSAVIFRLLKNLAVYKINISMDI